MNACNISVTKLIKCLSTVKAVVIIFCWIFVYHIFGSQIVYVFLLFNRSLYWYIICYLHFPILILVSSRHGYSLQIIAKSIVNYLPRTYVSVKIFGKRWCCSYGYWLVYMAIGYCLGLHCVYVIYWHNKMNLCVGLFGTIHIQIKLLK